MGNNGRIWLVGGTRESSTLAREMVQFQLPCTVTVTTQAAKSLYPVSPLLHIWAKSLDSQNLSDFLQQQKIIAILDVSHPYAVEISSLAIQVATEKQIPYLRYERPKFQIVKNEKILNTSNNLDKLSITLLDSFESLVTGDYLRGERVMLTSGYKTLHLFQPWQNLSTLFARILPSPESVQIALNAGFTPDRLIAIRPPISASLEKALWQQWGISLVVTKASGLAGGEDIKRSLAAELGIKLVIIKRPEINYPHQTSDLFEAIKFCQQIVG
ncbi:MAG: cobalt-precorrin-6A reductase [Microcoleaceae cyanobacterium MO_207.B10]|nr:cobalt-precorrin-6A reductase [Microcoleaceae cyanobacterium MO_207.B10]